MQRSPLRGLRSLESTLPAHTGLVGSLWPGCNTLQLLLVHEEEVCWRHLYGKCVCALIPIGCPVKILIYCGVPHHQMQPQEAAHLWLFGVEILHTVDRLNGTEICGY